MGHRERTPGGTDLVSATIAGSGGKPVSTSIPSRIFCVEITTDLTNQTVEDESEAEDQVAGRRQPLLLSTRR